MIGRLLFLCALALPLAAQISETIEVAVTNIDVVVLDAKGNRVTGLTKDDFEVIEAGKPRPITNFSEFGGAPLPSAAEVEKAPPGAAALHRNDPPPRRLMLVFDSNTLTPTLRRSGAIAAAAFIDAHVRPVDKVMVAVLSRSFTPRTEWTSDRAELRRVIGKIGSELDVSGADSERKRVEEEIVYLIDIAGSTVGTDPNIVQPPSFDELVAAGRRYADVAMNQARTSAALLGTVASQLAVYPEKKAMILVGEGVDSRPGWEIFEKLEAMRSGKIPSYSLQLMLGNGGSPNSTTMVSPMLEAQKFNAAPLLRTLAENAFSKGVPIYAINPGINQDIDASMETNELNDMGQQFARFASRLDGYKMVGEGSGGAAYVGMDITRALNEVAADLGGYYSIGFRASGPPKHDAIRVRVKRPSSSVRVALSGAVSPTDSITDAVTAHHVLAPDSNDLEIGLETGDPEPAGEKQRVKLTVRIPIRNLQLVRQGEELTGGFDVYLSISDGKGYFSPVSKQSHAIRWPAASVPADDDRTMEYTIDVTMEPGASRISVGVVDQRSKKTGYDLIEVHG